MIRPFKSKDLSLFSHAHAHLTQHYLFHDQAERPGTLSILLHFNGHSGTTARWFVKGEDRALHLSLDLNIYTLVAQFGYDDASKQETALALLDRITPSLQAFLPLPVELKAAHSACPSVSLRISTTLTEFGPDASRLLDALAQLAGLPPRLTTHTGDRSV